MLGAIIGDIIGSVYEFNNIKKKDFSLFSMMSTTTDDSMMTIAVSKAILENIDDINEKREGYEEKLYDSVVKYMMSYGRKYLRKGYGGRFKMWLKSAEPKPYDSFGNGSAMRVSPAGWVCNSLEDTLKIAEITASPTHNHPEGIKGAQSVAGAIYLLRTGHDKDYVKDYISMTFNYDLDRTLDSIRPGYTFHVSCQESVPEAFIAFLEGTSYEDTIRNAVSIGGDSDTIAAIAGSMAEVIYPIEKELSTYIKDHVVQFTELTDDNMEFYNRFVLPYKKEKGWEDQDFSLDVPDFIKGILGLNYK